ncbi:MAG: hypothetical protein QF926_13575 [Alphaproteobacteria bacterium]|nr:hypothetical protein [Alphaproteobacteria bacterium]
MPAKDIAAGIEPGHGGPLVVPHQARVTGHIGAQNSRQLAFGLGHAVPFPSARKWGDG